MRSQISQQLETCPQSRIWTSHSLSGCIEPSGFSTIRYFYRYNATDNQTSNKINVAIKIQTYNEENKTYVIEEYTILKELSSCIYLVTFYGVFKRGGEIWFVLEVVKSFCLVLLFNIIYFEEL